MKSTSFTYMGQALELARDAAQQQEVPVGAVVTDSTGRIVAQAHNRCAAMKDLTHHAELLAIQAACKALNQAHLVDCDLYVTLEPCAMCAGAISLARIRRLYFAAYDPKGGSVEHGARFFSQPTCLHVPEVIGGLREEEARELLQDFFHSRRS